ncbi:MAG: TolC family protein [Elusimicrobia bacterium]|nr:TolC family protein [Elusimicrobiota bacterium]
MKISGYRRALIACCFLWASAPCAFAQESSIVIKKIDREEAERLALLNNPSLLASLEEIAIAEQRLKMARHLLLPQLGFDATATGFEAERSLVVSEGFGGVVLSPSDNRRLYLGRGTIEQVLYTGGKLRNAVVLAKAALEKARSDRDRTTFRVIRDVRFAFLDALSAVEKEQLMESLAKELETLRPSSDQPGARLIWEDEKLELEELRDQTAAREKRQTVFALLRSIGMDLSSEVRVTGRLDDQELPKKLPTLNESLSWAREFRSEYRTEALESEMNATQVAIALASRSPVVSLAGMSEFLGNEFPLRTNNWSGMLRVHLPFSWDNWATIRERKAQQRKGQVRRVEIDDAIGLEVRQAHFKLASQMGILSKRKEHVERWRELYARARASMRSTEDRLELYHRYKMARERYFEAQAAALRARYEFEYAIGRDLP